MATMLDIEPQKLIGFAPDLNPSTPGVFQSCNNVVPTLIGFKSAASPVNAGLPALSSASMGGALILNLNGTARMFVGTAGALYEDVSGAWVNQSASGGYALATDGKWRFASTGNVSLAVNGASQMQCSQNGAFTAVPVSVSAINVVTGGAGYTSAPTVTISAPDVSTGIQATATAVISGGVVTAIVISNAGSGYLKAPTITLTGGGYTTIGTATPVLYQSPVGEVVFVANGQVFVCNCSQPAAVAGGDFWYCSGSYDYTQWNYTNMQTLSAYGQLIDTPGPITGGGSLGANAILFKKNSMYLGTQTGYPVGWDFQAVSKTIGALNHECIVSTNNTLYFIGPDDFYAYQGYGLPVPIGENVRRWFFATLNPNYVGNISSYYDQTNRVIYWAFPSNNSLNGEIDTCLTYNWSTGTWGMMNVPMQGFVTILNGELTYNSMGTEWSTYNSLPNISYNSSFWINFLLTPGYIDTTNTLQALSGTSTGATITTNAFGDIRYYSSMQQFFITFKQEPASGTAIWQGKTTLGSSDPSIIASATVGGLVLSDSRIDVDQSDRWHQLMMTFTGDFEVMEWVPTMIRQGRN
ncbi:hypothetical protein [Burkholderia guangdongensis]|uniref:hypothetical protein n=1 Tax=Burkholderia guangdongensis TaxID=1792500 RepID=UPI0015C96BFF|nr:hypothetical protein [Burkholderia guangdongensis]